jgi:hypothetical protein
MKGRELELLRKMLQQAAWIEKMLDTRGGLQEERTMLSRDCAARYAGRLKVWLDDMLFIAEAESKSPKARPPK